MAKKKSNSKRKKHTGAAKSGPGFILCLLPGLIGGAAYFASAKSGAFAEWYAVHLYPLWVGSIGRICALVPFSVMEMGWYALILLALFFLVRDVIRLIRGRHRREKWFGHWCRIALLTAGLFLMADQLGGSINYNRKPFSEVAGFNIEKSSKEELYSLCLRMIDGINETVDLVPRDENGVCVMEESFLKDAEAAMRALSTEYSCLGGYYPTAKPLIWSRFLSYQKIAGMYCNYSAEANYNNDIVPYNLPMTVCHELSHLKGFMREDEANFVGYLACVSSDKAVFRYSAYMLGYIYAGNALYSEDYDLWMTLSLPDKARNDMTLNSIYWKQFDTVVAKVSETANDVHLKAHQQTEGTKSYGRVVDLMLAYYRTKE